MEKEIGRLAESCERPRTAHLIAFGGCGGYGHKFRLYWSPWGLKVGNTNGIKSEEIWETSTKGKKNCSFFSDWKRLSLTWGRNAMMKPNVECGSVRESENGREGLRFGRIRVGVWVCRASLQASRSHWCVCVISPLFRLSTFPRCLITGPAAPQLPPDSF